MHPRIPSKSTIINLIHSTRKKIDKTDKIDKGQNRQVSSPPKKILKINNYFWPPAQKKKSKNRQIYQKKILKNLENLEKNLEKNAEK